MFKHKQDANSALPSLPDEIWKNVLVHTLSLYEDTKSSQNHLYRLRSVSSLASFNLKLRCLCFSLTRVLTYPVELCRLRSRYCARIFGEKTLLANGMHMNIPCSFLFGLRPKRLSCFSAGFLPISEPYPETLKIVVLVCLLDLLLLKVEGLR